MELKDLIFKKVSLAKPPCFGRKLLLIGVFKRYVVGDYHYTPAIVVGELDSIRKDELRFKVDTHDNFVAIEYAELDTEQGLLFENLVRHQKQVDL